MKRPRPDHITPTVVLIEGSCYHLQYGWLEPRDVREARRAESRGEAPPPVPPPVKKKKPAKPTRQRRDALRSPRWTEADWLLASSLKDLGYVPEQIARELGRSIDSVVSKFARMEGRRT